MMRGVWGGVVANSVDAPFYSEPIDARRVSEAEAVEAVVKFVDEHEIRSLNVAGPRASGWDAGYAYTLAVVGEVIKRRRPS
jgi:hypothetical protein